MMVGHESLVPVHTFIGRDHEIAEVTRLLTEDACRLLTISGAGGAGKTRLAIEVLTRLQSRFAHGAVLVALQSLASSELVAPAVASALGLTLEGQEPPETQLGTYLRDKDLFLVLDNFEHLAQGAMVVSALLARAPRLKVLVTSRAALQVQEEWVYPLQGLALAAAPAARLPEPSDAGRFFLYHARRVQPAFDLTAESAALMRLHALTAGLPLALELAATWLSVFTLAQIVAELETNLDLLHADVRNLDRRHRSMRAVFDQSWKLLSEAERTVFARLAVCRGGFDSAAAAAVAGASLPVLAALVTKSMVHKDASGRLSLHELLRQYGLEQLERVGQTNDTYARHSTYFARRLQTVEAAFQSEQHLMAMQQVESDLDNYRLAWTWAVDHQQTDPLQRLVNGLYMFGFIRSRYRETVRLFEYALAHDPADQVLKGRLLARRWGYLHWSSHADYREAQAALREAVAIAEQAGDPFEQGFATFMLAYSFISMQQYREALPALEASLKTFEALGASYYVAWVLHRIGYVYSNCNQPADAVAYTERSLALARRTHNQTALVICLYNLGSLSLFAREYRRARLYCTEALAIATRTHHQGQIAHAFSLLGWCAFCEGDYAQARDFAGRGQALIESIRMLTFQAYSLALLIVLDCLDAGDEPPIGLRTKALEHPTNTMGYQLLYGSLAVLACTRNQPEEARRYLHLLLALTPASAEPVVLVWMAPCVAYMDARRSPHRALSLLAWSLAAPDRAFDWVRRWAVATDLRTYFQTAMDAASYQHDTDQGHALSVAAVCASIRATAAVDTPVPARAVALTAREHEVLRLLAQGYSNPQIATHLVISTGTVKTHTLSIYRKLDVANRTQAIVQAQLLGLLSS